MTRITSFVVDLIGIIFLSIILIIEYYNNIIFTNGYSIASNFESLIINEFLRISLWKIHLFIGIILYFIFMMKYFLSDRVAIYRTLAVTSFFSIVSGVYIYVQENFLLHILHIFFITFSSLIFIMTLFEYSTKKGGYCNV